MGGTKVLLVGVSKSTFGWGLKVLLEGVQNYGAQNLVPVTLFFTISNNLSLGKLVPVKIWPSLRFFGNTHLRPPPEPRWRNVAYRN